ncbi:MAG TPA: alpha/beta hydrolase-fold protein [Terriglobales bacterium]|nr:alpha/beta hydrolase-fold protein [Terriglobales bacterium]
MRHLRVVVALVLFSTLALARTHIHQKPADVGHQSEVVQVIIHSPALENNLLGDPADQPASIYLPAAYKTEPQRRFAVLYFLHGYSGTAAAEMERVLRPKLDKLMAAHVIEPMIVVAPSGMNKLFGSFYTNSATTGNWDDYITRDVVGYVDAHYRTLAAAESRGISGHSMGGYGSLLLAFRHPDVFSSVYGMSPCCTELVGDLSASNTVWGRIAQVKSAAEMPQVLERQFLLAAVIAMDAAFAPDPRSPLYGDAPFVRNSEQLAPDPQVLAKFQQHILTTAVSGLLPLIARLKGIYIDYGAEDEFSHIPAGARALSEELAQAGIPNTLEVYEGTHVDHVGQRVEERMLPWMAKQLKH